MQDCGQVVLVRHWLSGAILLAACFTCMVSAPVEAHTILQRSDPSNNAVLDASPTSIRLWFSTVLNPAFSTAIVENAAYTYVNDGDARLASNDGREIEIPLSPHLSPGIYAVAWRVVSNADGYILTGSLLFAIARSDGTIPGQATRADFSPAPYPSTQSNALTLLFRVLIAPAILAVTCWICLSLWLLSRRPIRQRSRRQSAVTQKIQLQRLRQIVGWATVVSVIVILGLTLEQHVESSYGVTSATSPRTIHLRWPGKGLLSAFHATLLTSDKHYRLVLDITARDLDRSLFTLTVEDAVSVKPVSDVDVSLLAIMLDMPMGNDSLRLHGQGNGCFSASTDLSMGGLWQIAIQLSTADHRLHEATVKILMPY
ncbi:MAG TPA: copper resistance protein CopC [Ktedonobacteraceae bacterium]|nr:copper resistance protein CopC [Ktedonobacteraceae bacterium]